MLGKRGPSTDDFGQVGVDRRGFRLRSVTRRATRLFARLQLVYRFVVCVMMATDCKSVIVGSTPTGASHQNPLKTRGSGVPEVGASGTPRIPCRPASASRFVVCPDSQANGTQRPSEKKWLVFGVSRGFAQIIGSSTSCRVGTAHHSTNDCGGRCPPYIICAKPRRGLRDCGTHTRHYLEPLAADIFNSIWCRFSRARS